MTTVHVTVNDVEQFTLILTFERIWSFNDYQVALLEAGELARQYQRRPILIHDVPVGIRLPDNYVSRMGAIIGANAVGGTLMAIVVVRDLLGQRMMDTIIKHYQDAHPDYPIYSAPSLEAAYSMIRTASDVLDVE